ncbi:MAG: phage Gp37/Gp68 family protein, partial [Alphaproteobacteria bacterium HGW-Alphaproteobacteria-5]
MAKHTPIEWTDSTWNPIGGCTRVSEGCRNCYAEIMAARFSGPGQWGEGLAHMVGNDHRWTGKLVLHEAALDRPLRWREPRRIFVNSTSDLFHESVPDEWIDRVFAVMALAPQHTFQVLTKRSERMHAWFAQNRQLPIGDEMLAFSNEGRRIDLTNLVDAFGDEEEPNITPICWPLPNVWLGTSIEDQPTANTRIPHLLATPAAVRFVSAEPLLGPVDLTLDGISCGPCPWCADSFPDPETGCVDCCRCDGTGKGDEVLLDWVIVGGESGPHARPMHPDWARSLRDQCNAARVPFFFKQWGEWGPDAGPRKNGGDPVMEGFAPAAFYKGDEWHHYKSPYAIDPKEARGAGEWSYRLGKKRNGR